MRHTEGVSHGFLVLRSLEGETIATGDLIQEVKGFEVTSELIFHFKDGSIHDETAAPDELLDYAERTGLNGDSLVWPESSHAAHDGSLPARLRHFRYVF